MKTVIIEDETLVAKDLQKLLRELIPDIDIQAVIPSLEEARKWFSTHEEPELLFMDIQLADGVSFDLFNHVKLECPIIFTTAYDGYAIRAFRLNSIAYLLKPVDKNELDRALAKFRRWAQPENATLQKEQMASLLKDLLNKEQQRRFKERFLVHTRNSLVPVPQEKIAYFLRDELIYLVTVDNEKYVSDYHTMEEVEELVNPAVFFRTNRQSIIHIQSVGSVKHGVNGKLVVHLRQNLQSEIDVSREKAAQFKEWMS
jgi:two-component system, LytTR family, response regulator